MGKLTNRNVQGHARQIASIKEVVSSVLGEGGGAVPASCQDKEDLQQPDRAERSEAHLLMIHRPDIWNEHLAKQPHVSCDMEESGQVLICLVTLSATHR